MMELCGKPGCGTLTRENEGLDKNKRRPVRKDKSVDGMESRGVGEP